VTERITPEAALKKLAAAGGQRYVTLFNHGNLELEFYQPVGTDPQRPHTRDEVYFVISGSGWFVMDKERRRFGPGEVMYVPAGVPHRFEEFTDDFATWALFAPPV
jgi:mannose-6-phosphate isomerase-like protein (cupin superfamily)